MTLTSLSSTERTAPQASFDTNKARTLIAEYLNVHPTQITDEVHFNDDLGLDWLDRLELMILIEDEFDIEISESDANQIELVGDLIRILDRE